MCVTMFILSKEYDLGMFNTIVNVHYILYLVSYDKFFVIVITFLITHI